MGQISPTDQRQDFLKMILTMRKIRPAQQPGSVFALTIAAPGRRSSGKR
jgi:hypothetical protein